MIDRRRMLIAAGAAAGVAPFAPLAAFAQEGVKYGGPDRPLDVPYVPTRMVVVDKMLEVGKITKDDLLYDLGCGDGRIVVRAAEKFGARGVGIDLNPQRIAEANENAKKSKVTDRVKFEVGDLFKVDFSQATVVTMYLLPSVNLALRPRLWKELKPGTRIVSHDFDMGDWKPERTERVDGSTVYFWTIPARKG